MESEADSSVEYCEKEMSNLKKNLKYPKSVIFILMNIFFDRFSNGGVLAILALFLHHKLNFDNDEATALYHTNEFIMYIFTIIGAVIADAFLGVFKTIALMTSISALGSVVLMTGSLEISDLPNKFLSLCGLFVIVAASGALKTNQSVFGGKQFKLPEQEKELNQYFSMHYVVSKIGLLFGQIIYPIISKDFKCYEDDHCYPVAFILSIVVMICGFIIFVAGKFSYPKEDKSDNVFMRSCACIISAIHRKLFDRSENPKKHWLDYSEKSYGNQLITDTKDVLNVSKILCTMPIFWSIYGQCNSRWVFQANQMNGDLGFYDIKPDQMVMLTTLFSIISVPLADYLLYPLLSKIGVTKNLQKVTIGMSFAVVAFLIAAIIELIIQDNLISMLWLIPQYFMIALAEVFLWISTLSFVFSVAPESMKSVITSLLYLTSAAGSLIIIFVSGFKLFHSQFVEFLVFAFMMILTTISFSFTRKNYEKKTLIT